jgi:SecY interacting protein Syd
MAVPPPGTAIVRPTEDSAVGAALDRFVRRHGQRFPSLPAPFDAEWRSPCELDTVTQPPPRQVRWRPLRRPVPIDPFAGLARALEMPIHPDAKAFWGRYWSGNLEAEAADGHVSLLQLWNEDDADRLVENLIGHALAKRRARSAFTVFFAAPSPTPSCSSASTTTAARFCWKRREASPCARSRRTWRAS